MGNIAACLAENIKKLRRKKGLTQTELARRAGVSLVFIQALESQRKWVSPTTVQALADALEVSEARLFEDGLPPRQAPRKVSRRRLRLEHVPDDIYYALATICRHPEWKWEVFRWILDGYRHDFYPDGK